MRKGKMIAQGAHASLAAVLANDEDPRVTEWLSQAFTKICVQVNSLEQLRDIYNAADEAGVIVSLITDNGLTEFGGIPTVTCCAIGPDTAERIDPITGSLKLL